MFCRLKTYLRTTMMVLMVIVTAQSFGAVIILRMIRKKNIHLQMAKLSNCRRKAR